MSKTASDKPQSSGGLKALIGLFVYGATTFVVLAALGFWMAASQFQSPGPLTETKTVVIQKGSGLNVIAQQLLNEGVIENKYVFIFGTRILGAQADLKAGEYEFEPGASAKTAMVKLRDHDVIDRRITIREGLTSFEIVRLLEGVEKLNGDVASIPAEGSLLPNTYGYQIDEPRERIIGRLQQAMTDTLNALWENRAPGLPFTTKEEALILASIVEKETGVAEERGKVAGVFINRLERGIPLQTDPTVIYAINGGRHENDGKGPLGRRLLKKDLQIDSPYNTYKNPGLPPGPIANPGKASIEAVLNPDKHDYIYFVADGTGGHAFAKTLAEHNRNVAKWRKIRRSQN